MGQGAWSAATYGATTKTKIDSGTAFGYDKYAKAAGTYEPHALLDPLKVFAKGIIESRDSVDHPNSTPIVVGLDQTGSMGNIPYVVQKKLEGLLSLLALRGYAEDPQLAIAAYGDCKADPIRSTVQFSQFESDNRIDEALDNLLIVRGGGANNAESMAALWYMLTKVETDAWHKRGKKGYAFFVADEISHNLTKEEVKGFCGDTLQSDAGLSVKELAEKINERWEVFILLVDNFASQAQGSEKFYKNLFGNRNVLVMEDADSVSETIALAIGVSEGTLDIDDAEEDLTSTGSNAVAIRSSLAAVKNSGLAKLGGGNTLAKGRADIDVTTKAENNVRL